MPASKTPQSTNSPCIVTSHPPSPTAAGDDPLLTIVPSSLYSLDDLPTELAYPFWYEPHPLAVWACEQLQEQRLPRLEPVLRDAGIGKMFGVLLVLTPPQQQQKQRCLGYLSAYSGTISGVTSYDQKNGFVPLVYDRFGRDGFYARQEAQLNELNRQVKALESSTERTERDAHLKTVQQNAQIQLDRAKQVQKEKKEERRLLRLEMQAKQLSDDDYAVFEEVMLQEGAAVQRHVKALKAQLKEKVAEAQALVDEVEDALNSLKNERKFQSANLQNQLFDEYQFLNARGETKSLRPIFAHTPLQRPPSGAGDCAAPKLLHYAYAHGYKPVALAEFWWGPSPATEVRKHGLFYPACRGKCEPILGHMLQGLNVEEDPLEKLVTTSQTRNESLEFLYEDEYMAVINKPTNMLSVPGRHVAHSVYTEMKQRYPNATGPILVHRLDMATSGLLLIAKDKETHQKLQAQFIDRTIQKRYTALLQGEYDTNRRPTSGMIDLPLGLDYLNRPMQKVDRENGKPAVTLFEIINVCNTQTRVHFFPHTGRTHQLRVHAAHQQGLDMAIVGDDIYGQRAERLCLHAGRLELTHPITNERLTFDAEDPF